MKVSGTIMAHPDRNEWVREILDLEPDLSVVYDRCQSEWDTGRRALLDFDPEADYHVVVQDDAVVPQQFLAGVAHALDAVPSVQAPVSLYLGGPRPYPKEVARALRRATERGRCWIAMRGPIWGVGVALPTKDIKPLVELCDKQYDANYDSLLAFYFMKQRRDCYYTVPSLVDHRSGPSLLPGHGRTGEHRRARLPLGDRSPFDIDWSTGWYTAGDPTKPWNGNQSQGFVCEACEFETDDLASIVGHAGHEHDLGVVDMIAATPGDIRYMGEAYKQLPEDLRGTFWVVRKEFSQYATVPHTAVRAPDAKMALAAASENFLIASSNDIMNKYGESRSCWTLMEGEGN